MPANADFMLSSLVGKCTRQAPHPVDRALRVERARLGTERAQPERIARDEPGRTEQEHRRFAHRGERVAQLVADQQPGQVFATARCRQLAEERLGANPEEVMQEAFGLARARHAGEERGVVGRAVLEHPPEQAVRLEHGEEPRR